MSTVNDNDFIGTLKAKRASHLEQIEKLRQLVESIDNLILAYSSSSSQVTRRKFAVSGPLFPDSSRDIDFSNANLTEAIALVMRTNLAKQWRGATIHKVLREKGYALANLSQKISSRLLERSKTPNGLWSRFEGKDGYPRYQLKEALEQNLTE